MTTPSERTPPVHGSSGSSGGIIEALEAALQDLNALVQRIDRLSESVDPLEQDLGVVGHDDSSHSSAADTPKVTARSGHRPAIRPRRFGGAA